MITSDHGGSGLDHGKYEDLDIGIPFYIRGEGIKENYQLKHEVRTMTKSPAWGKYCLMHSALVSSPIIVRFTKWFKYLF